MVPTANDINAAITGLPAVFASRELIAACIGKYCTQCQRHRYK